MDVESGRHLLARFGAYAAGPHAFNHVPNALTILRADPAHLGTDVARKAMKL